MPEPTLSGKTFIVIGGGSGIGLETTKLLLESGVNVGVCDVNEEAMARFASGLDADTKARVLTGTVDVASRAGIRSFIARVQDRFTDLHGLASVAGVAGRTFGAQSIWDVGEDDFDFIMDVNLRGLFHVFQEALQPGVLSPRASIVHVGSEYSLRGSRGGALYSASKHGCLGMVKSVALECRDSNGGVRINAVLPGPTDTPGRRAALETMGPENDSSRKRPLGRPAEPAEIAEIILFLLSEKSSFVTGAAWTVDGGSPL
ncbi:oxidoreductase [Aspergillus coremiiformis]|uniref:Oxidoreductase n=1 Tax=Aspergillus coremiiformis TaxID=138285 RepID=A0A5N6Z9M4_9EURO|nr:oxidoreductase [Aspergillus coremiiformis]